MTSPVTRKAPTSDPSSVDTTTPTDVVVDGGYIRVVQDVRGKYGSEGDYVMNRPMRGPQNPTPVDHATDTWDTIDWLVKNVPESNGRVGILGISYNGFLSLTALVDPHPALKVAVPMNPMVDGWMGDDWFHYGAFRQQGMPYIHDQEATREVGESSGGRATSTNTTCSWRRARPASWGGGTGSSRSASGARSSSTRATTPSGASRRSTRCWPRGRSTVPTMLVHSLWDQEDIYGAIAVYKAIEPKDTGNDTVFLVMGPWNHGQMIEDGSTLGALRFNSDTSLYFRREVLGPFLAHYLKDDAPAADVPPVLAFETGTNRWQRLPAWPAGCASGCTVRPTSLYLGAGLGLGFAAPRAG